LSACSSWIGYPTLLIGRRGQTVGMMAVKVRVADARNGGPIGSRRALRRAAVTFVLVRLGVSIATLLAVAGGRPATVVAVLLDLASLLGAMATYLWPLRSTANQTLQDLAVGSVVVAIGLRPVAYLAPVPAPAARQPRTRSASLIAGAAAIVVLGVTVAAVFGDKVAVSQSSRLLAAPTIASPGRTTVRLAAGGYALYQEVTGVGQVSDQVPMVPANVSVTVGKARSVPVNDTFGLGFANGGMYAASIGFDAPHSGSYTITVRGGPAGTVVLARSLSSWLQSVRGWLAGLGIAMLTALAGAVLLVVGLVGRRARPGPSYESGVRH
jgi:hypothetical protein